MFAPRSRVAVLGVALAAAALAGCSSSHTGSAGRTHVPAVHSSAAAPAHRSASPQGARPDAACQAIFRNLDLLTKVATPSGNPDLARSIKEFRALAATAPAEIRPDLRVIADFDQKLLDAVQAGNSPDDIAETPELTAALSHEAAWTAAHCRPAG